MKNSYKYIFYIIGFLVLISLFSGGSEKKESQLGVSTSTNNKNNKEEQTQFVNTENATNVANTTLVKKEKNSDLYIVTRVVDGDTIDVSIDGKVERIRMIGINTPETVDPRRPVECFGIEASNQAKALLAGKNVHLEIDSSQGERDKYNRLLRYVFLEDDTNFGLKMIKDGYAYEYTYDLPYKYQAEYKNAQKEAEKKETGLWGDKCNGGIEAKETKPVVTPIYNKQTNENNTCSIKGNVNLKKEKIYHIAGCGSYDKTVIDETKGEKWFCSEQEALDAGWRKALNCN